MSKVKAAALTALALLAATGGYKAYEHHRLGQPILKGRCFLNKEDGSAIVFADVQKAEDEQGKEVEVYVGIILVGPFQLPMPLDIRKSNEAIPQLVKEGKATEVNCETGEQISQ